MWDMDSHDKMIQSEGVQSMKRIFNQLRKVHIAGLAGLVLLVALLAFLSVSPVRAEGDQRLSYNLA